MSKKDYELLAGCIADLARAHKMTEREKSMVCRFAVMINNRILDRSDARKSFDSKRFMEACKLP
jgi:hypothetical protein